LGSAKGGAFWPGEKQMRRWKILRSRHTFGWNLPNSCQLFMEFMTDTRFTESLHHNKSAGKVSLYFSNGWK
jgi:hypothetical protein